MWARLKRLFRSIFGAFISDSENPRKILEQNIRDMRDKVPEINEGFARRLLNNGRRPLAEKTEGLNGGTSQAPYWVTHSKKELRPLRARSCNPACGLRAEMQCIDFLIV